MSDILFISDIHIKKSDPILLFDIRERLNEIANFIVDREIKYVVILGDIWDRNDPRYSIENIIFNEFFSRIILSCDKVLLVTGNHGVTNLEVSSLSNLRSNLSYYTIEGCNIYFADYATTPYVLIDMGGCTIAAISHLPNIYLKNREFSSTINAIKELMDGQIADIFCSHFPVIGAGIGSYQLATAEVDPDELRDVLKVDKIILGDIHRGQIIPGNPQIYYPGSIERITFGECKEDKGILLYNIESKNITTILLNARPRFTGEYNGDQLDLLLNDISKFDKSRLRLKIKLNFKSGQNVDRIVFEFRNALSGIFEVSIDTFVESDRKVKTPALVQAKTPLEIFKAYVTTRISEKPDRVLAAGEQIIKKVDGAVI